MRSKIKSKLKPMTCRRREPPLPLPKGAWAEWGKDAVYFVTRTFEGGAGVSLNVINPNDERLTVYRITRFIFEDHHIAHGWVTNSCAILGSRAYVIAEGSMWSCDFFGGSESVKWIKRPALSSLFSDMACLTLFSMRGNLYVYGYKVPWDRNSFQLLLDGKRWRAMAAPPKGSADAYCSPIGASRIGDSKLILHVPTLEQARINSTTMVNISDENHFLVFEFEGESIMHGKWTHLKIRPYDDWHCHPCPRVPPPGRSYFPSYGTLLDAGSPLLLPIMPGKLLAFGGFADSDSSGIRLQLPQEVHIEWPRSKSFFGFESQLNTTDHWHVIHLGGVKYCIIAFPPLGLARDNGLFVFTFDLVTGPPPLPADGFTDTDTSSAPSSSSSSSSSLSLSSGGSSGDDDDGRGFSKFTAVNVRTNYRSCNVGGPGCFLAGKASTTTM